MRAEVPGAQASRLHLLFSRCALIAGGTPALPVRTMQRLTHQTRCFDGFTLDLRRGCLLRGAQEIKLRPKPFEALKYLVENSGRLINKAELIQVLWPETAVTDDSLVQCMIEVRRALGDEAQQMIKTVPRRGYIFDRPVVLGKIRVGPDLANIGKRAPAEDQNAPPNASPTAGGSPAATANVSPAAAPPAPAAASASPAASPAPSPAAQQASGGDQATSLEGSHSDSPPLYSATWHHRHLYSPRSLNIDSGMPAYKFLYEKRRVGGQPAADALKLSGNEAVGEGWEVVPTYDAKCLVAYLMSLDQSHPLKEVKSTAPPSPPAPGKSSK